MNIQAEELLKYLASQEELIGNNDFGNGYSACIEDVKDFIKLKFNQIVNV